MKRLLIILCGILCVLFASFGVAQEKSPVQDEPQINQLEWMVGDWQAVEKSDSGDLLVHLSAHKSENQQAILYYVSVESKGHTTPMYNGMYYWHPGEKTFRLLQVDRNGNLAEGTYKQTGNRVVQMVKTASGDGDLELKSEWEIRPREFHFVAQFRPAGKTEWKPALDVTYSRVGAGALTTSPRGH